MLGFFVGITAMLIFLTILFMLARAFAAFEQVEELKELRLQGAELKAAIRAFYRRLWKIPEFRRCVKLIVPTTVLLALLATGGPLLFFGLLLSAG